MVFDVHFAFRIFSAAVALSSSLIACSGSDADDGGDEPFPAFNGDCTTVKAVPTFAQLEQGLLTVCRGCHSAQVPAASRHDAPEGLDFDTYEQFVGVADPAVLLVKAKQMPPPPSGVAGPTDSDSNELYAWAACGKPR